MRPTGRPKGEYRRPQAEGTPVTPFNEAQVEQAARAWLEGVGWRVAHGPDIAPDTPVAERRRRSRKKLGFRYVRRA